MAEALAPIPEDSEAWKWLWTTWQIRSFVVLSLVLQTILLLVAPLRKRSSSSWVIIPIWSAYLLADWVANAALGLIGISGVTTACDHYIDTDYSLLAFWATFFLSHLGGQDTITASSLEDNELWRRHLLGLLFRCFGVFYVVNIRALPVKKDLRIATIRTDVHNWGSLSAHVLYIMQALVTSETPWFSNQIHGLTHPRKWTNFLHMLYHLQR